MYDNYYGLLLCGYIYARELNNIRIIQYALNILESEIVYTSTPLIEAFQNVSDKSSDPIKKLFSVMPNTIQDALRGAARRQPARRADFDLRGSSRVVAAEGGRGQSLAHLSRIDGAAAGLCRGSRFHPCRADADHGASVRRLLGLSADRTLCADQSVRITG